jgi:hypothetical protein
MLVAEHVDIVILLQSLRDAASVEAEETVVAMHKWV